jgi:hypothetical protein
VQRAVSEKATEEKKIFEDKLEKALDEAWSKLNLALEQTARQAGELEMSVRLAAEAVEYSSALFSLTYGLEDADPEVRVRKNVDTLVLVKDSVEALKRARELREKSAIEAYSSLRTAADFLKTAYLDQVKRSAKRTD